MLLFDPSTDPAFNLAAEEFLLKELREPVLRLWRNSPCIVMGRHQNPYEEVNLEEAQRRGLPVLRRLSGGGTVFHDLGNINFTFILPVKDGRQIDFRRALTPVIQALHEAGADVRLAGRSDLTLAGRKVSGNAMYTWQDRCLHHGTLLYKADLDALDGLLRVPLHDYRSRSIKSIRSLVTNISEHMETPPETTDFMRTLAVRLAEYAGEQDEPRAFSDAERERIQAIRDLTYTTWEWNFGRTPRYELDRPMLNGGGERVADIRMTVENGYISSISFGRNGSMRPLEQTLLGTAHNHASIRAALALHSDILDARRMSLGEATAALF